MEELNFFERLKQNELPVVVDFWAPWCGPCRMIDPMLKKLGQEYTGRVDVWKVNADEHPDLLRKLGIYGIPTVVAFRGGQEVDRRTGAASPAVFSGLFEAALSGEQQAQAGPGLRERIVRLLIGVVLLIIAYQGQFTGWYLLPALAGGIVLFSAVYDRCPVYKMVSTRIREWVRGGRPDPSQT